MNRRLLWMPLLAFVAIAGLFAWMLSQHSDRQVRSRLIGKPLPAFALPPAAPGKPGLATAVFQTGKPRLLNVFGSWCVPCAAEAPQLARLAKAGAVIDAIAIRDTPADVARFLSANGDPFAAIGDDRNSSVQLALGSSGVPETFVIDGRGRIAHQHIGAIRDEDVPVLLEKLAAAR
ncbi:MULTISPECIES: DsbE family thiol:disulfide interchange protein [unclassified Sphingomonas]|uniref:DsbE family thiol:disulfide interchange protein n=1 Tax=unclassified Sphingomonas TaxID=196159 RepID=UPI0006F6469F|nr:MULTISPECIES: DsbE family thiol:disulfide interchange protein [unclassified Sphingomonas]KQM66884.1 alkyl hydroperoxide reductase [Sphingomonas sp. Leaf16]KQN17831.1 alkyl hydroperoxide reductase [Sphingomonas sp. Leaf29]KQN23694.1 alkyl hydroperoxide reductase [Sphingomonas sp. Leaf32]